MTDAITLAFQGALTITLKQAASLLDLDRRTLSRMAKAGAVPHVRFGARGVRFTEKNIRDYLEHGGQWASIDRSGEAKTAGKSKRRSGTTTLSLPAKGFMAQRASDQSAPPKRSRSANGRK